MEFRIADTFTDSLAKLTGDEQKAVKTTAFDLQMNPANPGLRFHKLDKAKDKNFWSVRVSGDIRLIVHRTDASMLLCYVDHHDAAYRWGERRKIERHPKTGAAQLVEIREKVTEIIIPKYVEVEGPAPTLPLLFENTPEEELLSFGVPLEWIDDVRHVNEVTVLELADHLPPEAAEALLELATGGTPVVAGAISEEADAFEHPDAQRRFWLTSTTAELTRAFEYPWDKWMVFLHPAQRQLVKRDFNGPARVAGSAGTGKTIVAIHRAAFLARRHPDARILLTTFSQVLANALKSRLHRLISNEPRVMERIDVHSIGGLGLRLYQTNFEKPRIATREQVQELLNSAAANVEGLKFTRQFLWAEWLNVIDAWQIYEWEAYRDVSRLGCKSRLIEKHREVLWSIFEKVRAELSTQGLLTMPTLFALLAERFQGRAKRPYDFAVIDEAQDIDVAELRFFAALGGDQPNGLFFAGDLGQCIYQQPFSWKALGVDVRGRSHTLRINYRTSHQIRSQSDRLLAPESSDVDGIVQERRGTVSVFNGVPPMIHVVDSVDAEVKTVASWINARLNDGIKPHEIGVFVRSLAELCRAEKAIGSTRAQCRVLDDRVESTHDHISVSTMHRAKGLEFRAVVVMACDDEILPLQERIQTASVDSDLEDVYNTERHLLYVACTRARDYLFVTGVSPASEFLDDLVGDNRIPIHARSG